MEKKKIDPLTQQLKDSVQLEKNKKQQKFSYEYNCLVSSVRGFLGFKNKKQNGKTKNS